MINRCGCFCDGCKAHQKECPGCVETVGEPYWTQYIGGGKCPVYACCGEKAYAHCGECGELPCKIWYDLKDPSLSEEEHLQSILERVHTLQKARGAQ